MNDPKVQLTRLVGKGRDRTAGVTFSDIDGKVVSLGFDGRYTLCPYSNFADYDVFADCPVIDGDGSQKTDSLPVAVIRNLRDALNNLNLGD
jgi:hypothetical protein